MIYPSLKPGELVALTEEGERIIGSDLLNNNFLRPPKTGEPLLFLKSEPVRIAHIKSATIQENDGYGGYHGEVRGVTPRITFKDGIKLSILYQDSIIFMKFELSQAGKYLKRLK